MLVDPHGSGLDPRGQVIRALQVRRPDRCTQAEFLSVEVRQDLFNVVVDRDRQRRTELLRTDQRSVIRGIGNDGWLHEVPGKFSAGAAAESQPPAVGRCLLHQPGNQVTLRRVVHGAHPGAGVEPPANHQPCRSGGECFRELGSPAARHENALDRHADLPGVAESRTDDACCRKGRIGVGQDDCGIIAAQLQGYPLHCGCRLGHDGGSHFGGTGEGNLPDARERAERPAQDTSPRDAGENVLRKDGVHQLHQGNGGQRRAGGRLGDDRAARNERGSQLHCEQRNGKVPRGDGANKAHRLVLHGEPASVALGQVLGLIPLQVCVVVEQPGRHRELHDGFAQDLALFPAEDFAEPRSFGADGPGDGPQGVAAGLAVGGPGRGGGAGPGDGQLDVGCCMQGSGVHHFKGGRVMDLVRRGGNSHRPSFFAILLMLPALSAAPKRTSSLVRPVESRACLRRSAGEDGCSRGWCRGARRQGKAGACLQDRGS